MPEWAADSLTREDWGRASEQADYNCPQAAGCPSRKSSIKESHPGVQTTSAESGIESSIIST